MGAGYLQGDFTWEISSDQRQVFWRIRQRCGVLGDLTDPYFLCDNYLIGPAGGFMRNRHMKMPST